MSRPEFVTYEDVERWNKIINEDPVMLALPEGFLDSPIIKEVCYAGLWLSEELDKKQCPGEIISRIQWHAGKLSFGRDAWEVHQKILQDYQDNKLIFESNPNNNEPSN